MFVGSLLSMAEFFSRLDMKFFEISQNRQNSIKSIEGLRGLAILLVFFVHYVILIEPFLADNTLTFKIAKNLWNIGRSGVDLFFVLSGFLIYGNLIEKEVGIFRYLKRRARRIYPAFLAVFALYLLLSFIFPAENKIPKDYFAAAIFIAENLLFLPGLFDINPIISVAWSLSYEVFFYLTIPIVIWIFSLRKVSPQYRIIFFASISIGGFVYFSFFEGHIRLLMFLSGIILHDLLQLEIRQKIDSIGLISLVVSFAAMIFIFEAKISAWFHYLTLYCGFFLLCLDCFSREGFAAKLFSFAPFRWFGNISYSYYLIHGLSINAAVKVLTKSGFQFDNTVFWVLMIPTFLVTMVPSVLLFLLIEKPFSFRRKTLNI
jgi:exopolysaccharide production protein ExoZ